jgi:hypothetical protein
MAAFLDVCRFNPTAGGTSDWTYASAVTGYQSLAAAGAVAGRLYKYRAESTDLSQWEVGEGAYHTSTGVLVRSTVLFNSVGTTSKINFSTVPQVAIVALKEDLLSVEEANSFTAAQRAQARSNISAVLRGQIWGLAFSTTGSSGTFSVSAGEAADSTAADLMMLASSIAKTTSAWSVGSGNGGLDTGSIAANTWYHAFLIKRPDSGVVDVLFSLSATLPVLPANYTLFRRIFSVKTDSSSQWVKMVQDGDVFRWTTVVNDVNVSNPGTSAVTRTLSVPTGVRVRADLSVGSTGTSGDPGAAAIYVSDLLLNDQTPAQAGAVDLFVYAASVSGTLFGCMGRTSVMTNTSAQVRTRVQLSTSNMSFVIDTHGWTDRRGRES